MSGMDSIISAAQGEDREFTASEAASREVVAQRIDDILSLARPLRVADRRRLIRKLQEQQQEKVEQARTHRRYAVCGYWGGGMIRPCQNRVSEEGMTCHIETHTR